MSFVAVILAFDACTKYIKKLKDPREKEYAQKFFEKIQIMGTSGSMSHDGVTDARASQIETRIKKLLRVNLERWL